MSVHNWFTIEIYDFAHSLCTFLACQLMVPSISRQRTRRIEDARGLGGWKKQDKLARQ